MLPKAHLSSHSRMSGYRWVITALCLSGSWRSLLYNSSVYSYHFLLISSASVRSILFLPFIEPMKCSLDISNFLEEISRLSHSVVFLYLHWSLRKAFFLSLLVFGTLHSNGYICPFLLCFLLLFFSQLFVKPPQTAILLFCIWSDKNQIYPPAWNLTLPFLPAPTGIKGKYIMSVSRHRKLGKRGQLRITWEWETRRVLPLAHMTTFRACPGWAWEGRCETSSLDCWEEAEFWWRARQLGFREQRSSDEREKDIQGY